MTNQLTTYVAAQQLESRLEEAARHRRARRLRPAVAFGRVWLSGARRALRSSRHTLGRKPGEAR
jgi:hypothetical protein